MLHIYRQTLPRALSKQWKRYIRKLLEKVYFILNISQNHLTLKPLHLVIRFHFNTLRPRQNGHPFADDTFNRIFLYENGIVSIRISLKFFLKGPIDNIPALVQIMAWRRSGDKPLSEPMMINSWTHLGVTHPQ